MKVYYDQLKQQLQKQSPNFYFIYGSPEILSIDAQTTIENKITSDGYTIEKHFIDSQFDPNQLLNSLQNIGLFHQKKLIELHCYEPKIPASLNEFISSYLENPVIDTKCLVKVGKLSNRDIPAKLTKLMDSSGIIIPIYPLKDWQIANWVKARALSLKLQLSNENITLILEYIQNSVDMCNQILTKLALEYGTTKIDNSKLKQKLFETQEFETFDLMTHALSGNSEKTLQVIEKLQNSNAPLPILLWMIASDIRELTSMAHKMVNGEQLRDVVSKSMPMKRPIYTKALQRLKYPTLTSIMLRLPHIDKLVKGLSQGNPWVELQQILLTISGKPILPAFIDLKK